MPVFRCCNPCPADAHQEPVWHLYLFSLLVLNSKGERQDYSHPNTLDTFKNKQNLSDTASDKI